jgi:hypothetical protein
LPTFSSIFQHFLRGGVRVADKIANKIEHFGLDKPLISKDDQKKLKFEKV